ncbi:aminotransferase class III-fold pyridoxal phosphate-dependent enzyme [Siccirubricoccus deserti]
MARGEGCRLWDVDGREYLDLLGEYTAGLFGHSEKRILDAVRDALERGINLASVGEEGQLASLIVGRFPRSRWCASPTAAPRRTCWRWRRRAPSQGG